MKKIIVTILALLAMGISTNAQTFPAQTLTKNSSATRGGINAGGTYLSIGYATGQNYTIVTGTVTPASASHPDTLFVPTTGISGYGTDTGYVFYSFSSNVNKTYDLQVNSVSGTLAGTAILQGSTDGQGWHTLTGNTTYCTGCAGASATLTGSGTTHYQWYMPKDADNYQYHQIRAILSGTCTATFSGTQIVSY